MDDIARQVLAQHKREANQRSPSSSSNSSISSSEDEMEESLRVPEPGRRVSRLPQSIRLKRVGEQQLAIGSCRQAPVFHLSGSDI